MRFHTRLVAAALGTVSVATLLPAVTFADQGSDKCKGLRGLDRATCVVEQARLRHELKVHKSSKSSNALSSGSSVSAAATAVSSLSSSKASVSSLSEKDCHDKYKQFNKQLMKEQLAKMMALRDGNKEQRKQARKDFVLWIRAKNDLRKQAKRNCVFPGSGTSSSKSSSLSSSSKSSMSSASSVSSNASSRSSVSSASSVSSQSSNSSMSSSLSSVSSSVASSVSSVSSASSVSSQGSSSSN